MFSPFAVHVKHDKLLSSRRWSRLQFRGAEKGHFKQSRIISGSALWSAVSPDFAFGFKRCSSTQRNKNGLLPESENLWQRELCAIKKKKGIKKTLSKLNYFFLKEKASILVVRVGKTWYSMHLLQNCLRITYFPH